MTQEEKAKAYDKAIKRASNLYKDAVEMENNMTTKTCEIIFPELAESEDERIRKELHIYLDWLDGRNKDYHPKGEYSIRNMISWLEKQGQTFTKKDVDGAYLKGVCDTKHELEKQGELNPAWSEEDEIALGDALWCCKQAASIAKNENDMGNVWYAETWLKTLKDRVQPQNTWKPSDRQMASITCAVRKMKESACYDSELVSLYQDLKKLKG